MSDTTETFWIIFDTCTKPDYYADVHNLLALPQGWILRYNYRRELLSQAADDAIFGDHPYPTGVLLVYAQSQGYSRGGELPAEELPADMLFVPTRLAKIALIPAPDGERAHFDLAVSDYPPPEHPAFGTLMQSLVERQETPYRKWVTLSDEMELLREIEEASNDKNWEQIVDVLARPPAQFIGDIFWRLGVPTAPPESRRVLGEELRSNDGNAIYQVESRFELYEGNEAVVPVMSHTPAGEAAGTEERRYVEVASPGHRLKVGGSGRVELRRYSQSAIRIRAADSDEASATTETLKLSTSPQRPEWPRGPEFEIAFIVSKSSRRLILGILLLLSVPALGAVALSTDNLPFKMVLGVLGAAAAILGWAVLTGKIAKP